MSETNVLQMPAQATFDDFWEVYPRKEGKALARAKFLQITSSKGMATKTLDKDSNTFVDIELKATSDEIVEGAKRYVESQRDPRPFHYGLKDDGKYIPQPSRWLNQGRWEDYV